MIYDEYKMHYGHRRPPLPLKERAQEAIRVTLRKLANPDLRDDVRRVAEHELRYWRLKMIGRAVRRRL